MARRSLGHPPLPKAAYKEATKAETQLEWLLPVLDALPDDDLLSVIAAAAQAVDRRAIYKHSYDLSLYGAKGALLHIHK